MTPNTEQQKNQTLIEKAGAENKPLPELQQKLLQTERNLNVVIDSIPDPLLLCDGTWNIVQANSAATSVLEYTEADLKGMSMSQVLGKNLMSVDKLEALTGDLQNTPLSIKTKSGDPRTMLVSFSVIPGTPEKDLSVVSVLTDITEIMKVQDELKKKNYDLERFTRLSVSRELKMVELKKRIKRLEREIQHPS